MLKNLSLEQEVYWRDAVYRTPDWSFDATIGRYRDKRTGRFLSKKEALDLTEASVGRAGQILDGLTESLTMGAMSLQDWQREVAKLLKTVHLAQFILGKGGAANTFPADYLVVARTLKSEYQYLDKFAADIASGRLSAAQIKARARLYVNKTRTSYWMGDAMAQDRATQPALMRRILAVAEHCPDCLAYAAAGWVPVGTLPMPCQACECGANCRCSVEYKTDALPGA